MILFMVEPTALLADEDDGGVAAALIDQATATESRQTESSNPTHFIAQKILRKKTMGSCYFYTQKTREKKNILRK